MKATLRLIRVEQIAAHAEVEALDAMDMSLEDKRMFFQTNAERVFKL